ncbi:GntR family transcriptional regulator [Neobacillus sp. PS3-12]|nr:GntR family transcriptional regulator [Neobacillus sp. PS3-12]WML54288.1 GntR family transcriptional regulator [Neobacillus sp. PS3-12]
MAGSKVYIEIVKQLRKMINADGLKSGDKIPSERELSERLNVGRSSVREALRALELLGLIETRRGEGTFIKDFQNHQLVQLLSTFILQDEKAQLDVFETKCMIEMDSLRLFIKKMNKESIKSLKEYLSSDMIEDGAFFNQIVQMADNHLLYKIWVILKDYCQAQGSEQSKSYKEDYAELLKGLERNDEEKTLSAYRELRKLSTDL